MGWRGFAKRKQLMVVHTGTKLSLALCDIRSGSPDNRAPTDDCSFCGACGQALVDSASVRISSDSDVVQFLGAVVDGRRRRTAPGAEVGAVDSRCRRSLRRRRRRPRRRPFFVPPASWIGLLPPSVLTYTAQPAILSELLCILGAEACVVYVSRIGIHMKRSFGTGALQGCCWSRRCISPSLDPTGPPPSSRPSARLRLEEIAPLPEEIACGRDRRLADACGRAQPRPCFAMAFAPHRSEREWTRPSRHFLGIPGGTVRGSLLEFYWKAKIKPKPCSLARQAAL